MAYSCIYWLMFVAGTIASEISIQQQVNQTVNRCTNSEALGGVHTNTPFYHGGKRRGAAVINNLRHKTV